MHLVVRQTGEPMLKHVIVHGVQYGTETVDDMERREKAMQAANDRVDALREDWERQRRTPMRSMIHWARKRGLL